MSWDVWGKTYYSDSDLTDQTVYQPLKFDRNVVLRAVRIWVIFYNDPTFTSLTMKIFSNNENASDPEPRALLHSSSNRSKSDIISSDYGVKEIYFEFSYPSLRRGTWYHFVLNASGYSGASSSQHIAWRLSYPDPIYDDGVTAGKINTYPLAIYPFVADFEVV